MRIVRVIEESEMDSGLSMASRYRRDPPASMGRLAIGIIGAGCLVA
jgi:hypothetical protein